MICLGGRGSTCKGSSFNVSDAVHCVALASGKVASVGEDGIATVSFSDSELSSYIALIQSFYPKASPTGIAIPVSGHLPNAFEPITTLPQSLSFNRSGSQHTLVVRDWLHPMMLEILTTTDMFEVKQITFDDPYTFSITANASSGSANIVLADLLGHAVGISACIGDSCAHGARHMRTKSWKRMYRGL